MKKFLQKLYKDKRGAATLEVVLIIVVAISLVIVFREQISSLVESALGRIENQSSEIIDEE